MARRPLLLGLGVGGILVLVVLAALGLAAASAYTSTSTFCTNCHEMTTRYVSWTRSTHAQVECMDCHSGVGLGGYLKAKVNGVRQVVQHYFGRVGNIAVHVHDPVCLKCHYFSTDPHYVYLPDFQNDPLFVPDKLHRAHFEDEDSTCTTCHEGMVHGSVVTGGVSMDREVCETCHIRKKIYVEIDLPTP